MINTSKTFFQLIKVLNNKRTENFCNKAVVTFFCLFFLCVVFFLVISYFILRILEETSPISPKNLGLCKVMDLVRGNDPGSEVTWPCWSDLGLLTWSRCCPPPVGPCSAVGWSAVPYHCPQCWCRRCWNSAPVKGTPLIHLLDTSLQFNVVLK